MDNREIVACEVRLLDDGSRDDASSPLGPSEQGAASGVREVCNYYASKGMKLSPQPHADASLGFLNVNFSSTLLMMKSISVPIT